MLILAFFVVNEQRGGAVLPVPIWFMKTTSFIQEKWWEKKTINQACIYEFNTHGHDPWWGKNLIRLDF